MLCPIPAARNKQHWPPERDLIPSTSVPLHAAKRRCNGNAQSKHPLLLQVTEKVVSHYSPTITQSSQGCSCALSCSAKLLIWGQVKPLFVLVHQTVILKANISVCRCAAHDITPGPAAASGSPTNNKTITNDQHHNQDPPGIQTNIFCTKDQKGKRNQAVWTHPFPSRQALTSVYFHPLAQVAKEPHVSNWSPRRDCRFSSSISWH